MEDGLKKQTLNRLNQALNRLNRIEVMLEKLMDLLPTDRAQEEAWDYWEELGWRYHDERK